MVRWVLGVAVVLPMTGGQVKAGPLSFELQLHVPPVVADRKAVIPCTVTYIVADTANNDLYAVRMRIEPVETNTPVDDRLRCPATMPPRVGLRALDVCTTRTGESKYCVFADVSRGFDRAATINNTSENASRCGSDKASDIGVACWMSGKLSVCNVACGTSPEQSITLAQARCQDKQQQGCPVTATVPVSGP